MSMYIVISTMVHTGENTGRMLHALSVWRSLVLIKGIFLLGIVSVGLFSQLLI